MYIMPAEDKPREKLGKIEKIEHVERIDRQLKPVEETHAEEMTTKESEKVRFNAAMDRADTQFSQGVSRTNQVEINSVETSKPSPIQEAATSSQKLSTPQPPSQEGVLQQTQQINQQIESIKIKLNQPGLNLGSSAQQALLTEKLNHVNSSLKTVLSKSGVELKSIEPTQTSIDPSHPAVRFLRTLTQSQDQMMQISNEIGRLNATGDRLSPERLLAVQIKLGFVQQQMEFFSNLLNKLLESTKTIMNVQV